MIEGKVEELDKVCREIYEISLEVLKFDSTLSSINDLEEIKKLSIRAMNLSKQSLEITLKIGLIDPSLVTDQVNKMKAARNCWMDVIFMMEAFAKELVISEAITKLQQERAELEKPPAENLN